MFCNKCGNEIKENQLYCNKCGNRITYSENNTPIGQPNAIPNYDNESMDYNRQNVQSINRPNIQQNDINVKNKVTTKYFVPIVSLGIIIIIGLLIATYNIATSSKNKYSFDDEIATEQSEKSEDSKQQGNTNNNQTTTTKKNKTDIITDNTYTGLSIKSVADAKSIIVQDSVKQKQTSDYPQEIIEIEKNIIEKYGITAVNLKELEIDFAKELENVIGSIWEDYPKARAYLTNLSLTNLTMSRKDTIALFMPIFLFGTSDSRTTRPWVIKTQVQLNSKFFLNVGKLETAVQGSSKAGHFPPNATKYSPVAHELGHYLSFIALLNSYSIPSVLIIGDNQLEDYYDIIDNFNQGTFSKQMLNEAYQNYLKDTSDNIDFDEWRGKISKYALAKDDSGNYIYDETIAEAFHDVYLNKDNAAIQSKYIVEILKKYVGK